MSNPDMQPDPLALAAELRGEQPIAAGVLRAEITQPDADPLAPAPAKQRDPLDVTPAPALAPSLSTIDKLHSKAAGGDGYAVTVYGTYTVRAPEGKGKVQKNYKLVFKMPYLIHPKSGASALGLIVGKLLNPMLKKLDPNALHYRTHHVESAVPLTPTTAPVNHLQFMDRARIERYIIDNSVPVDPRMYPEITELREVVMDHKLNPDSFKEREAKRSQDRADTAELLAMNPEITAVDHGAPQTVAGI